MPTAQYAASQVRHDRDRPHLASAGNAVSKPVMGPTAPADCAMTSGELSGKGSQGNRVNAMVPGHHRNPDCRPHNRRGRTRSQRISRSLSHPAIRPRRRDPRRRAVAVQHRSAYLTGVALPVDGGLAAG